MFSEKTLNDKELYERFLSKTIQLENGCVQWTGSKYGVMYFKEEKTLLSVCKYVYEKQKGIINYNYRLNHTCNTKYCVNPNHLFSVDAYEKHMVKNNNIGNMVKNNNLGNVEKCSFPRCKKNAFRKEDVYGKGLCLEHDVILNKMNIDLDKLFCEPKKPNQYKVNTHNIKIEEKIDSSKEEKIDSSKNDLILNQEELLFSKKVINYFELKTEQLSNGCILWTGRKLKSGFGIFNVKRDTFLAHRFAYMYHKGRIHNGFSVNQICKNKLCVNIEHLYLIKEF